MLKVSYNTKVSARLLPLRSSVPICYTVRPHRFARAPGPTLFLLFNFADTKKTPKYTLQPPRPSHLDTLKHANSIWIAQEATYRNKYEREMAPVDNADLLASRGIIL